MKNTLRSFFALLAFLLFVQLPLHADEGMWIPMLLETLNEEDMQENGLKLTAEDIYSINQSSLKDAIALFGGGCTSEIISGEGLLLTNHHCGYGRIQYHSSVENDYLTDGFWAMSKDEELANPGLSVTFLVRMEDVTEKVLEGVTDDMSNEELMAAVEQKIQALVAEVYANEPGHEAAIRPFFYGNEFYMLVYKNYNDVRLVGAPPSSIGKYGGDTDNWMWPRHTGDFSLFRIYANAENEPAEYSEDNVPYKPARHLPVSLKGVQEGDFTMVYGYPGRTQQYLTSHAVEYVTQVANPARINMRALSLGLMQDEMAKSDKVRIQYAAKYARISNYHKKWIGESRGLKKLHALDVKKEQEAEFTRLVNIDANLKAKYGKLLPRFEELYADLEKYALARDYFIELYYYVPEVMRYAGGFAGLVEEFETLEDEGNLDEKVEALRGSTERFFKDYHQPVDKKVFAKLMDRYQKGVDPSLLPDAFNLINTKYKGDTDLFADYLYETSYFASQDRMKELLSNVSKSTIKKIKKDPSFILSQSLSQTYRDKVRPDYTRLNDEVNILMRTYVAGLMEVFPNKTYWPDANSTLRLTYGKVEGYYPADGVTYRHYSTLDGVIAKYVPGDREFDLPAKMLKIHKRKDYGQYANDNGEIVVCFTASNHTTGGNSGSPVIDGEGNLIGLNFDRSWESTMSDIMYDPERCRNISVDIRYVLFIIDKFAGATHLIDEMTLVKEEVVPVGQE